MKERRNGASNGRLLKLEEFALDEPQDKARFALIRKIKQYSDKLHAFKSDRGEEEEREGGYERRGAMRPLRQGIQVKRFTTYSNLDSNRAREQLNE
jgi:hypothetical protein